jgi:hypothetical protein
MLGFTLQSDKGGGLCRCVAWRRMSFDGVWRDLLMRCSDRERLKLGITRCSVDRIGARLLSGLLALGGWTLQPLCVCYWLYVMYYCYIFRLRLVVLAVCSSIFTIPTSSSSFLASALRRLVVILVCTIVSSFTMASPSSLMTTSEVISSSILATSLDENVLRSAVKSTECAHPASFPHSARKRLAIASYVALVRLECFPFPNL